jgi:NAD(P)-dependent dehydrogenase (short-subunit alcohol dehydrogenase family)
MARKDFAGLVAWVTGASSGIGRALALELASRGADVAISARREDLLRDLLREVEQRGQRCLVVPCDVTDESAVMFAVEAVARDLGKLDVAIANAGFGVAGRVESLTAADWRRQLETNVVGLAMTARYAIGELKKTHGRLGLVGSVSAMVSTPGMAAYSASKAAVRAIGQTLSMELDGTGVSCTTIHPGFVVSDIARVDNQGRFDANRKDKRPQNLMWPTSKAARVMVDALARRDREYVFTMHGKLGAFMARHAPGIVHYAMTRPSAKKVASEQTKAPAV